MRGAPQPGLSRLILRIRSRTSWGTVGLRELRDVLQLQADIAEDIAGQIHKLVVPGHRPSFAAPRVHPEAYEACLKGIFFRDKMTVPDLAKSTRYFKQAIDFDPTYAQAHANLSQAYFYLGLFGMGPPMSYSPKRRLALSELWN